VELTAIVIAGLARVWALATYTQVQRVSSLAALEHAVRADVIRAAHLAAPTLDAFDNFDSRTLNGTGGDTIHVLPASDAAQLARPPSPASAADHVGEQPPG
jgi:hypothetical protein